ncbi:hypothetical protein [Pelagovum pacificum]|uniref:Uncharacterized protein n=1 Tax=Pelagovum pacificum TaxID=2588711 RepID=A0A5C5GCC5_9RHOB|nr:hypothetical protein [Pelagovum pacificum]QQA44420.1 hypothetical protein I8N54_07575 [Pelagovum pacificum]TNY32462.1 hypothetical protein FHY64_04000 [Pelagovum pacificum]
MRGLGLGTLIALLAGTAQAALPPCVYDDLVREAPLVFHMSVDRVDGPDATGLCFVRGHIATVFRGEADAAQPATVRVACANPDNLVGPTIFWDRDALAATPFLEVHGAPGKGVAGHGAGLVLLDTPTGRIEWQPECGG